MLYDANIDFNGEKKNEKKTNKVCVPSEKYIDMGTNMTQVV